MARWTVVRIGDVQLDRIGDDVYVAYCTKCTAELQSAQTGEIARDWARAHATVCPCR